jgi:hypothetical protein
MKIKARIFAEREFVDLRIEAIPGIPYASAAYLSRRTGACLAIAYGGLDEIASKQLQKCRVCTEIFVCANMRLWSEQRGRGQQDDRFADLLERAEHIAGLAADLPDSNPGDDDAGKGEQQQRYHRALGAEAEQEGKNSDRKRGSNALPRRAAGAAR